MLQYRRALYCGACMDGNLSGYLTILRKEMAVQFVLRIESPSEKIENFPYFSH